MMMLLPFGGQAPLCQQDNYTLAAGFLGLLNVSLGTADKICGHISSELALATEDDK